MGFKTDFVKIVKRSLHDVVDYRKFHESRAQSSNL